MISARIKTFTRLIGVAAVGLAAAIGFWAGPAGASASSSTQHSTVPAEGVFTCQGGDLTVTGGVLDEVFHTNTDAKGVEHVTGTIVPHGVTLTDASGNTYTLSGAIWFGGKATPSGDIILTTDTDHLVIRTATGGVYAKVQAVHHFNITPSGQINDRVSFDKGSCEAPEG